jgi:hypothetical protein
MSQALFPFCLVPWVFSTSVEVIKMFGLMLLLLCMLCLFYFKNAFLNTLNLATILSIITYLQVRLSLLPPFLNYLLQCSYVVVEIFTAVPFCFYMWAGGYTHTWAPSPLFPLGTRGTISQTSSIWCCRSEVGFSFLQRYCFSVLKLINFSTWPWNWEISSVFICIVFFNSYLAFSCSFSLENYYIFSLIFFPSIHYILSSWNACFASIGYSGFSFHHFSCFPSFSPPLIYWFSIQRNH